MLSDCLEYDKMYLGHGLRRKQRHQLGSNNYGKTENAKACQLKCQETKLCKWFNWNNKKDCFLKTDKGTEISWEVGAVTGPRDCPGKYNRMRPKGGEGVII